MENETEAIYNEDSDENLVIDDENESEVLANNEAPDRENLPVKEKTPKQQKTVEKVKLTPEERGKKLADLNRQRKEQGIQKKKPKSLSKKSGVLFSVSRIIKDLKKMHPDKIISQQAGVYLASVLEYMCSEVLDLSGDIAISLKKKRITPQYIQLSIQKDQELHSLLNNVIIAEGGVVPYIHPELLKTKSSYKRKPSTVTTEPEQEPVTPKKKRTRLTSKSSQTESTELEQSAFDEASQTESIQQAVQNISASVSQTEVPRTQETAENQELNVQEPEQVQSITSGQILEETDKIPSTQTKEINHDESLELSEIEQEIDNITGIYLDRASTPIDSESQTNEGQNIESSQTKSESDIESSSQKSEGIQASYQSSPVKEIPKQLNLETETEKDGNSSNFGKKDFINFESYLNVQASSHTLIDMLLLSNRRTPLTPISPVNFENVLRPIENNVLITDRKIIPNVSFNAHKSRNKSFENF